MMLEVASFSDDILFLLGLSDCCSEKLSDDVCVTCTIDCTGHGGSRAADYVKQNLFKNLLEHPQFVSDTKLAIGTKSS